MALVVRKAQDRGHAQHGWLESYHTFSFSNYYDPRHMDFRVLRVINEDFVQPGKGFSEHGHQDMEILTWVLEGALQHKDSMGNGSVIRPGDLQYMSAGTGVTHSEFNASDKERVHLLQIWIVPDKEGARPRYGQKSFGPAIVPGALTLLASSNGDKDSIAIRADAKLFAGELTATKPAIYALSHLRNAWVQVTHGMLQVNKVDAAAGDGVAISQESKLAFSTNGTAKFLLFDLP